VNGSYEYFLAVFPIVLKTLFCLSLPAIPILSHNPTACNNYLFNQFSSSFEMRPICQAFNRRSSSSSFGEANLPHPVCEEIFPSSF
jgi:hypothetical protein